MLATCGWHDLDQAAILCRSHHRGRFTLKLKRPKANQTWPRPLLIYTRTMPTKGTKSQYSFSSWYYENGSQWPDTLRPFAFCTNWYRLCLAVNASDAQCANGDGLCGDLIGLSDGRIWCLPLISTTHMDLICRGSGNIHAQGTATK